VRPPRGSCADLSSLRNHLPGTRTVPIATRRIRLVSGSPQRRSSSLSPRHGGNAIPLRERFLPIGRTKRFRQRSRSLFSGRPRRRGRLRSLLLGRCHRSADEPAGRSSNSSTLLFESWPLADISGRGVSSATTRGARSESIWRCSAAFELDRDRLPHPDRADTRSMRQLSTSSLHSKMTTSPLRQNALVTQAAELAEPSRAAASATDGDGRRHEMYQRRTPLSCADAAIFSTSTRRCIERHGAVSSGLVQGLRLRVGACWPAEAYRRKYDLTKDGQWIDLARASAAAFGTG